MSQPPYLPPPPRPYPPPDASGAAMPATDEPFSEPVDLRDRSAAGGLRVPFSVADGFVALLMYFLGQLVVGLLLGVGLAIAGQMIGSAQMLAVAIASQLFGLLLAVGYLALRRRLTWRILGPRRPSMLLVAIGLGVGIGGTFFAYLLNGALSVMFDAEAPVEQQLLQDILAGGWATALAMVAGVVVAPIAEEFIFRGLIFQALRRRIGLWLAACISAAVFTAVHVEIALSQPLALVGLFALGVLFAWTFHRSGSLLVPILAHAVFNAISLTLAVAVDRSGLMEVVGLAAWPL